jgi:sarcosine oxidase subunit delta
MRLTCPHCGDRDRREFTFQGAALERPEPGAEAEAWHAYVHLRDNPAGTSVEWWQHDPCATWLRVARDTVNHAVQSATEARR